MKRTFLFFVLGLVFSIACNRETRSEAEINQTKVRTDNTLPFQSGHSEVNGLQMYYEVYGKGKPLVLIHGGGSTIQSTFGKVIPLFAKSRQIIAVELQAHGRTSDRNADSSFEQDADDVATLLANLQIDKADFFGFSNGGTTTLQIAIRHPEIVNKIVLGSALAKRSGVPDFFWEVMNKANLENMPQPLKQAYLDVAANPDGLQVMHDRDAKRMVNFKDIPDALIESINVPTLLIIGDKDIITPEHALELHRQIPNSELAIIPGGHGAYIGEITTLQPGFKESQLIVPLIEKFLDQKKEE